MSYQGNPGQPGPQQPPYQPIQPTPWQHQDRASGDPGTLDLPYYNIGFKDAVLRGYKKYARFRGRASRSEFWWFFLFLAVAELILEIPLFIAYIPFLTSVVQGETPNVIPLLLAGLPLTIFTLASALPSIGIGVRRLHDGNFSGWFYLLHLVPGGSIVVLVLSALESKPEGRRFDRISG